MAPLSAPPAFGAGLYLYLPHPDLPRFAQPAARALAQPFVDGAAIMVHWDETEKQPGVYDWSVMDRWILETLRLHKAVSIGVIAGMFTPEWLYAAPYGVPRNVFRYNRSSIGVTCATISQPAFWAPAFAREYAAMMQALAAHLRGLHAPGSPQGSAYDALAVIKLGGINHTTEELRVDTTKPDDGPCRESDAAAIWAQSGFTPGKVVGAVTALAAGAVAAFPQKILALPIIHRNAFPPIDEAGNITSVIKIPDALTATILNTLVPLYGNRLLVQWNALWQGQPPKEVQQAGAGGARIGFQMNGFMGTDGGSGCIYPGWAITQCRSGADFQSIMDNGMNLGAGYIEVQVPSVLDPRWGDAFRAAHQRLQSLAAP